MFIVWIIKRSFSVLFRLNVKDYRWIVVEKSLKVTRPGIGILNAYIAVFLLLVLPSSVYAESCGDLRNGEEWIQIQYRDEVGSHHTIYGVSDLSAKAFQPGFSGLFRIRKVFFKPKNSNKYISQAYNGKSDVKYINSSNVTTVEVLDCEYMNKVYSEERKGLRVQKLRFE